MAASPLAGAILDIAVILAGGFWNAIARRATNLLVAGLGYSALFYLLLGVPGAGIGYIIGSSGSNSGTNGATAAVARGRGVEWTTDPKAFEDLATDYSSARFFVQDGKLLYVSPSGVRALDLNSGRTIWTWKQGFCEQNCGYDEPGYIGEGDGAFWFGDVTETWSVDPNSGAVTESFNFSPSAIAGGFAEEGDFANGDSIVAFPSLTHVPIDRGFHGTERGAYRVEDVSLIPNGLLAYVTRNSSLSGLEGGVGEFWYQTELVDNAAGLPTWTYTSPSPLKLVQGGYNGNTLLFNTQNPAGYDILLALDANTGQPKWRRFGKADRAYPAGSLWLLLSIGSDQRFSVLDTTSGEITAVPLPQPINDSRVIATKFGDDPQIALATEVDTAGSLQTENWRVDFPTATPVPLEASGRFLENDNVVGGDWKRLIVLYSEALVAIDW
jgi:hypothetical protein